MAQSSPEKPRGVHTAAKKALGGIAPRPKAMAGSYPSHRTEAGRDLPPYYLVYFLLVELLRFPSHGHHEKVAWSVPVAFKGKAFAIEHRKMGLGVFACQVPDDEPEAREIVALIKRAVRAAEPFFAWLAAEAVRRSEVNVVNKSSDLYARFAHLVKLYRRAANTAERRKDEKKITSYKTPHGSTATSIQMPYYRLKRNAQWLALSCIEAFFGWTEHALIHLALLTGRIQTATEVATLADANWADKFKAALDLKEPDTQRLYNELVEIRRQLRNAIAHGSFGKQGEAFSFHSSAGAVPVLLPHRRSHRKFSLGHGLSFHDDAAIALIEEFVIHLWSGPRAPAQLYIQESHLPTILTFVTNGTYRSAMASIADMTEFIEYWSSQQDRATDMEW